MQHYPVCLRSRLSSTKLRSTIEYHRHRVVFLQPALMITMPPCHHILPKSSYLIVQGTGTKKLTIAHTHNDKESPGPNCKMSEHSYLLKATPNVSHVRFTKKQKKQLIPVVWIVFLSGAILRRTGRRCKRMPKAYGS